MIFAPQHVAAVIDVAQEHVERAHTLLEALFENRPLFCRHDPRDHVEGNQPLLGFGVAIDGEGDADPAEQQLRFLTAIFQRVRRRLLQPARELLIGRTEVAVRAVHFIERNCHISRGSFRPRATVHDSKGLVARPGPARYAFPESICYGRPWRCLKKWLVGAYFRSKNPVTSRCCLGKVTTMQGEESS